MQIENGCTVFNNKLNYLLKHDIVQNYKFLHSVVQRLS
jgi:hypothetical protein